MHKLFTTRAFEDYLYWQDEDRKTLKRVNALIKDIERSGVSAGIGKPERLKHRNAWSRRIDDANRMTYTIEENTIILFTCKGHYYD